MGSGKSLARPVGKDPVKEKPGNPVKEKQENKGYRRPDECMQPLCRQPCENGGAVRKGAQEGRNHRGEADGKDDSNTVDSNGIQVGDRQGESEPGHFALPVFYSGKERKGKDGKSNQHKLDAGAGWSDNKAHRVVEVS